MIGNIEDGGVSPSTLILFVSNRSVPEYMGHSINIALVGRIGHANKAVSFCADRRSISKRRGFVSPSKMAAALWRNAQLSIRYMHTSTL